MKAICFSTLILTIGLTCSPEAGAQSRPRDMASPDRVNGINSTNRSLPPELTLPVGTLLRIRTTEPISSDKNRPGDAFTCTLEQPIVAQGWVVSRLGQVVEGRVVAAQPAGQGNKSSQLAIELTELVLVDGNQALLRTELVQSSGPGTSYARDAGIIGTATGTGAVIGAVAGGGEGAAIGAAIGAAAGVAGALSTRGRATEIPSETVLTFRLEEPVTVSTQNSQQAFLPVTQRDYAANTVTRRIPPQSGSTVIYAPPYYYAPYYYYGPYYNYAPYYYRPGGYGPYGYYRYYTYKPRIYGAPRGYVRPGNLGRWR
jgi:hypothetical protein